MAARTLSFKLAAEELALTPSAVSHQMKELETQLGVQLFRRRTRGLELTTDGHQLREEIEPLLDATDRTLALFARRAHGRRALRLRLPGFFASELLLPRLAGFCDRHPEIDLQLDTREPCPAIHPAGADVSVVLAESAPPGAESVRLFASPFTAACAPRHAPAVSRLGRQVFASFALIVERALPAGWASWAEEVGLASPEPRQRIELDTTAAVVRAAECGLGVALVPGALCESRFRAGTLLRVFPVQLATDEAYHLVTRPREADHRPEVRDFMQWALGELRRDECA